MQLHDKMRPDCHVLSIILPSVMLSSAVTTSKALSHPTAGTKLEDYGVDAYKGALMQVHVVSGHLKSDELQISTIS